MTKSDAKLMLIDRFKRLPKRNRENLLFHLKKGTPICCGEKAWEWLFFGAG